MARNRQVGVVPGCKTTVQEQKAAVAHRLECPKQTRRGWSNGSRSTTPHQLFSEQMITEVAESLGVKAHKAP